MKKPDTHKPDTVDLDKVKKSIGDEDTSNDIDIDELEAIRASIANAEDIVEDIIELMPNVELIIETISSLVVSPNNMIDVSLNHSFGKINLPSEVYATLAEYTKNYAETVYDLNDNIINIVKKTLYYKGSYVNINIPPVIINNMLSKFKRSPVATIASANIDLDATLATKTQLEYDNKLIITDSISDIIVKDYIIKPKTAALASSIYTEFSNMNSVIAATASTNNITIDSKLLEKNNGRPIVLDIDPRDIIPIASKQNPSKHYGYFYMPNSVSDYDNLANIDEKQLSNLYKDMNKVMLNEKDNIPSITNVEQLKNYVIKNKLNKYTKDMIDEDVTLNMDDSLAIIVAERIIKSADVKFIYIPEELVSYYAINYRPNGTGKSLIEKIAVLASIKNILLFSNLMAVVKSNITTTEIDITLDENDVNYKQTIRKVLKEYMEGNKYSLPIRMIKVDNFIKWSKELGIIVKTNHPNIPDTEVTITERKNEINPIDTEIFENIDNDIITGLYGIPDMMENINDSEFAITVRQKYLMLDKRIRNLQKEFNSLITTDYRKKFLLDKVYITTFKNIIRDNLTNIKRYLIKDGVLDEHILKSKNKEHVVEYITYNLIVNQELTLPKPLNKNDEVSIEDFNNYVDTVENTIDKLLSSDALPSEIAGDISDNLDSIKAATRVMLIRDYMAKNSILPEFNTMFTLNEKGEPNDQLLESYKEYFSTVSKIALQFIDDNEDDKGDVNEKLEKVLSDEDNPNEDEDEYTNEDEDETPNTEDDDVNDIEENEPVEPTDDETEVKDEDETPNEPENIEEPTEEPTDGEDI